MTTQAQASLEALLDLVANNQAATKLYQAALGRCGEATDRAALAAELAGIPVPRTCMQTPQTVLNSLVRRGALAQTTLVNGEPYQGTPEEFAKDEGISAEARITYSLVTTELGRELERQISPAAAIAKLFAEKPEHVEGFEEVLALCDSDEGATRDQIAEHLNGCGVIRYNPSTGQPFVFPAYYTGKLEDAGALVWDGTWRLTKEGEAFLESRR